MPGNAASFYAIDCRNAQRDSPVGHVLEEQFGAPLHVDKVSFGRADKQRDWCRFFARPFMGEEIDVLIQPFSQLVAWQCRCEILNNVMRYGLSCTFCEKEVRFKLSQKLEMVKLLTIGHEVAG